MTLIVIGLKFVVTRPIANLLILTLVEIKHAAICLYLSNANYISLISRNPPSINSLTIANLPSAVSNPFKSLILNG